MIILFLLLVIILFLIVPKIQLFKRKHSNNKLMTQLGMALLVGTVTLMIYFTSTSQTVLKYTVVGMGLMSFIAIMVDMVILKSKEYLSKNN